MMTAIKLELEAEELLACRVCLVTDTKLFEIHEHRLEEAFADILGTPASPGDGFPRHVCSACRAQIRRAVDLRARSRAAHALLVQLRLQYQHITTDSIRSIDRSSLRLTEDKTDILQYPATESHFPVTTYVSDYAYPDSASIASDNDAKDDVEPIVENGRNNISEIEIVETSNIVENTRNMAEVEIVETDAVVENTRNKKTEVKKKRRRRVKSEKKKVIKVKAKPEVEWVVKKKPAIKKTGFKRYFMSDEDYVRFEEKYNIQVIRLTEEEQALEMEARRCALSYRNALVRCEPCGKGFLSAFTYENHRKAHDPAVSGPNKCRWCGCHFKWPNNLRTHLIEAHQLKYVCKLCQRVVKGRHEALLHSEFHAGKTWQCAHCSRSFKKKSTFYTHVRMSHGAAEPGPAAGTCGACGETFKGPPGLKLHQIKKCNKNMKKSETSSATEAAPALVTRKSFICEVCGKKCTSLSVLAVHQRAHTGDRPHACPAPGCALRFSKKHNMEKHHRVVHLGQRPSVSCDVCGKRLAHAASLRLHVHTVHLKLPAPPRAPRTPRACRRDMSPAERARRLQAGQGALLSEPGACRRDREPC